MSRAVRFILVAVCGLLLGCNSVSPSGVKGAHWRDSIGAYRAWLIKDCDGEILAEIWKYQEGWEQWSGPMHSAISRTFLTEDKAKRYAESGFKSPVGCPPEDEK